MNTPEQKLNIRQRLGRACIKVSLAFQQDADNLQQAARSPRTSIDQIDDLETRQLIARSAAKLTQNLGQLILR